MYRLNQLRIKEIWKTQNDLQQSFTQDQNYQFAICPFTIILGTVNSTEAGYKPPNSIPNDYTSFSKIFTGREAIQAVWDNSYIPIQEDPNNPNKAYKQLKIGDVYYGNIVSDQVGISYSAAAQNNAFIQEQAVKNVVINIPNQDKNFKFINNILSNIYKLYILPEINAVKNSNNTYQIDRQWYILETATKTYNNETKELVSIQCTFVSLNDKIATSGLAINQYVQLGSPGDPIAFPILDENKNVIIDVDYLKSLPITHCQISFYGSVKVISIALWGRDIDNSPESKSSLKFEQYATKLLFPYDYQCSTYDPISFQALPETNYFLTVNDSSQATLYTDWKNAVLPSYDKNSNFHYEGENQTNSTKTKLTNSLDASGRYLNYWDTNFLQNVNIEDYNYIVLGNPYFQNYNVNTKVFRGQKNYNMNNNKFKNLAIINAMHYFVYNPITEIPLSIRETIKINLNTIPVFGTFFNFFVGGLNINAKTVSNLLIPQFHFISGLISCELYNFYITILYGDKTPSDPVSFPLDVFRNGTTDAVQGLLGTASHMTSFTFNLTDQLLMTGYNDSGISTQPTYRETYNIGQEVGEGTILDNVELLPNPDVNLPLLREPLLIPTSNYLKWAIDMLDIKVMGKSDFKITFYSQNDRKSAVNDDYAVWSGTYQTIAKASNNIRLISNNFILANNNFKFDKPFNYPKAINPPPLLPIVNPIFIDMSDQVKYGIINTIESSVNNSQNYQMRPFRVESTTLGTYWNSIYFKINDYGYKTFIDFMNDYESITFNFTIEMSANYVNGRFINTKRYFTPLTIKLSDISNIVSVSPQFQVNNNQEFLNNSGNHNDINNNWTFNINNNKGGDPLFNPDQTASLIPTTNLNNCYINNLLWTNDLPTTSGKTLPSSIWVKIIAFSNNSTNDQAVNIVYQFISTLDKSTVFNGKCNWNLTTSNLTINPKSINKTSINKQINELIKSIENNVSRETLKGGD